MIRLGSLAGYPFEGPRVLGGYQPPDAGAVFAILYRADPDGKPHDFAVIDVDHADNLRDAKLPFGHARSKCWEKRAGTKWGVHIAVYEVPGGTTAHREQIVKELLATYKPGCAPEKYDNAWDDDWIQKYDAPNTTAPLTTTRDATET